MPDDEKVQLTQAIQDHPGIIKDSIIIISVYSIIMILELINNYYKKKL